MDLAVYILIAAGESVRCSVLRIWTKYNGEEVVGQDFGLSSLPNDKLFNGYKIF
jgi:hypothetical protein